MKPMGKIRVAEISEPGLMSGDREEKRLKTIAMHEPAPISAALTDTATISFGRIRLGPRFYPYPDFSKIERQNAGKDNTTLKGTIPQSLGAVLNNCYSILKSKTYNKC